MCEKLKQSIIFQYLEQLIYRYKDADLSSMSAQISYYLILAFFPFLIFSINLLSFTTLSSDLLFADLIAFLPNDTGILIKDMLQHTVHAKSKTLLFISMMGGLWIASEGITAIIRGLNKSYGVKEDRNFIKLSFMALISTIGIIIMMILEIILIIFGEIIGTYVFGLIGATNLFNIIWSFLRYSIPFILMFITFSLIYMYLPNRKLKFYNVLTGSLFSTVGWVTISVLFSFYVNNFANYEMVYGGLGGVIALIIWFYISTLIVLLGGELIAITSDFENKKNSE